MSSLKEMFSTPKRAALAVACLCVILVTAGVCIVMIANGARGPEQSTAIGGEAAQNFAFADAGVDPASAQAVKVKYERYQGTFVYEVEFLAGETEYEYKINAADGSVVKKEQKAVMGPGNSVPVAGTITLEEARDIALADAGVAREEAVFTEAKQDMERGVPVFEFKFYGGNVEYEYEINGQTGAVYSKKTTTYVSQDPAGTPPPIQTAPPASQPPASQPPASQTPATQPPATAKPTPAPATQPPATQAPRPTQPSNSFIGSDAAKQAALADAGVSAGDARFTKVRMDYEDGVPVYEVEFYTATHEYDYEIHAQNGSVFHKEVEAHQTSSGNHHGGTGTQTGADIGAEAAKNAALNHAGCAAGDVVFTKVERDYDDGWLVYEIEFYKGGLEYEFEIDGTSGAVLKFERD